VLFDTAGRTRIIDLGLACTLTSKSCVSTRPGGSGTGLYMSPERCRGHSYDNRDDVWALGCILAGGLCRQPFLTDRAVDNFAMNRSNVDELIGVARRESAPLAALAADMLRDEPSRRPTAQAVVQALEVKALESSRVRELEQRLAVAEAAAVGNAAAAEQAAVTERAATKAAEKAAGATGTAVAGIETPSGAAIKKLFGKVGGSLEAALECEQLRWAGKSVDAEDAAVVAYILSVSGALKTLEYALTF
jgi:eukaryotic-like serine/threonine-protein kinase